jgi:hypothetical protein
VAGTSVVLPKSSPLHEILQWSASRPDWQQDALRRIVEKGNLDIADIEELERIERSKIKNAKIKPTPLVSRRLTAAHLPSAPGVANSVCEVEEKMEIRDISAEHVGEGAKVVAEDVYKFMRLVRPIVEAAEASGFFRRDEKQDKRSRGDFHVGFEGELGAWKTWIGFDARVWAENGETPIWIECGNRENIGDLKKKLHPNRDELPWFDDGDQIVVPIRLRPGAHQEVIVGAAVEQIGLMTRLLETK